MNRRNRIQRKPVVRKQAPVVEQEEQEPTCQVAESVPMLSLSHTQDGVCLTASHTDFNTAYTALVNLLNTVYEPVEYEGE